MATDSKLAEAVSGIWRLRFWTGRVKVCNCHTFDPPGRTFDDSFTLLIALSLKLPFSYLAPSKSDICPFVQIFQEK